MTHDDDKSQKATDFPTDEEVANGSTIGKQSGTLYPASLWDYVKNQIYTDYKQKVCEYIEKRRLD